MKPKETGARYVQYLAALTVASSLTSYAVYTSWCSPILPKITSKDSSIGTTLTPSEASWVVSSTTIGVAPAAFLGEWMLSRFGQKNTLLTAGLSMFFPWLAIMFAKSALTLFIARFIAGVGGGIASIAVPIYIGEISENDIRGKLGTTIHMMKITGNLFIFTLGPFVSYITLAISCSFIPLLFVTIFWFMPESPYYLIKMNRKEEARMNIIRLSSSNTCTEGVQARLDEINQTVQNDMKNESTLWELLTNPNYRKSLFIMTGIKLLQQVNGSIAIEAYMQTIITESKSSISPEMSSIIFGLIQIPAVLITAALVDKLGRKPLLIISALGCALALFAEGLYFYLHGAAHYPAVTQSLSWLPTSGLVLFVLMHPIGLYTVPYVLLGEIFPTNIKNHAVSLFVALGGLFAFMVTKLFEPIAATWGIHTVFLIFTAVCISGALFVYCVLPETKGKTFMEIQSKLNKTSSMPSTGNI